MVINVNPVADPGFPGGRGARESPTSEVRVKNYYLANFLRKLHENERNWTGGGGEYSLPPILPQSHNQFFFYVLTYLWQM